MSSIVECGPAVKAERSQAMVWHAGGGQFDLKRPTLNLAFAQDGTACGVKPIWPDPGGGRRVSTGPRERSGIALWTLTKSPGRLSTRLAKINYTHHAFHQREPGATSVNDIWFQHLSRRSDCREDAAHQSQAPGDNTYNTESFLQTEWVKSHET